MTFLREADQSGTPAKRPLKLFTSFLTPSISYSPAAVFAKPGLRNASVSPVRPSAIPRSSRQATSNRKIELNASHTLYISSPNDTTRYTPLHRRSHSWTSPTKAQVLRPSQISNTLSSTQRASPVIQTQAAIRSPSLSCVIERRDRLGVLPPPRPRSRSSLAPPAGEKDEDVIQYFADLSLNANTSSTSIASGMTIASSDSSLKAGTGKTFHPLRGGSLSAAVRDGPALQRQKSFSSLAQPRLANIEVMSKWSTESSHPQPAATKLVEVQRMGDAATPVVSQHNPFFAGFASKGIQGSSSVAKTAAGLPHLRPSHHGHVSAPMVSTSVANLVIPPPLESRPRMKEKLHRRATTSKSRQPSQLNMNLNLQAPAGSCDTPLQQRRLHPTSFGAPEESQETSNNRESDTPSLKVGKWGRDLFGWKAVSSLDSPTVIEGHEDMTKASQARALSIGESALDEGDDEEEIEVFLGFNDI